MTINRCVRPLITVLATALALGGMNGCSHSSSPTMATAASPTLASVALGATNAAAGSSAQATVGLTAAALPGGATISLVSSNPAVATVQPTVTIVEGSSSATFMVSAVGSGTARISASLNGSSSQSQALTVTPRVVALASISLSRSTVVGGSSLTGTAILTSAAPAGGAVVVLSSANPVAVPGTVTVPAGSVSVPFSIATTQVGGAASRTITGSYAGTSASATLKVTPPTIATAGFGVTGPAQTETCALINGGNTLDCTFDGSPSTAPGRIIAWDWTYGVAAKFAQTTSVPQLSMPAVDCSMLPAAPLPPGNPWFTMTITLTVHDDQGNVSEATIDDGARLLPQGVCGF